MILHENGEQVQYLNKEMKEEMCLIDKYPSELKKKVSLITYFRKYMNDHLLKVSKSTYLAILNDGYINVGDGCWRRNVLVTTIRCR